MTRIYKCFTDGMRIGDHVEACSMKEAAESFVEEHNDSIGLGVRVRSVAVNVANSTGFQLRYVVTEETTIEYIATEVVSEQP